MSKQYDDYIKEHRMFVRKAYDFLVDYCPDVFLGVCAEDVRALIERHDSSKKRECEYYAYDEFFYGEGDNYDEFDVAWLNHIHANPHHWQHWLLVDENPTEIKAIEMPKKYIVEMVCDWWSFSWKSGNLREIFDWYGEREDGIILAEGTKKELDAIMSSIEDALAEFVF